MKINKLLATSGMLQQVVKRRFDTEGGSQGAKWAPLSRASELNRRRQGFPASGPILVRSGVLRDAAVNADPRWSATAIDLFVKRRAGPRYVGGGIARKKKRRGPTETLRDIRVEAYAMALSSGGQTGGIRKVATLPSRPFFGEMTKGERPRIDEVRDFLIQRLYATVLAGGRVSDVL